MTSDQTTAKVVWHLTFFHAETDRLVADITVTEEEARAIWLATGHPTELDPFGEHAVEAFLGASAGAAMPDAERSTTR